MARSHALEDLGVKVTPKPGRRDVMHLDCSEADEAAQRLMTALDEIADAWKAMPVGIRRHLCKHGDFTLTLKAP